MAGPEFETATRIIGTHAERGTYVLDLPHVREWLQNNPEDFRSRAQTFTRVTSDLRRFVRSSVSDVRWQNVARLKTTLQGSTFLSVFTAIDVCSRGPDVAELTIGRVTASVEDIQRKIVATDITQPPEKLFSKLLLEGYGFFIENTTGKEYVADTVRRACMELLFTRYRNSELFEDIKEWMIEEKGAFVLPIQDELTNME